VNTIRVDPHDHHLSIDDALEFLDTLELEDGVPVDHLNTATDAIEWLRARGVVHDPCEPALEALEVPGPAADRALRQIRSVREALRELVDATVERRPPSRRAVDAVNRAMAARQRLVLTVGSPDDGRCVALDHRHEGDPLEDALGRVAERIAREVAGDDADRVRVCANDECRWAFYDSSRTGRRRWCDMSSCGNRAKAARHRARVKATKTTPAAEPQGTEPNGSTTAGATDADRPVEDRRPAVSG
jgi:predicted RNA-binding Zn ribbon-like protein